MNDEHLHRAMAALRAAAVDDVLELSDDELMAEVLAAGGDPVQHAQTIRARVREAIAKDAREALARRVAARGRRSNTVKSRPSLEVIKTIVHALFEQKPSLGLAFRDGKRQSDADWLSLYDDLVMMGAIKPSRDGD